jgi:hypothetical protein
LKSMTTELPVKVLASGHRPSIAILVPADAIEHWCLMLCLIEKRLIETVYIVAPQRRMDFQLQIDENCPTRSTTSVRWLSPTSAELRVCRPELERWTDFYLKYYRNGFGEVDHIDVEFESPNGDRGLDVALIVPSMLRPRPADEALRRRLGLPRKPTRR